MIPILCYPLPFNCWTHYSKYWFRFVESFKEFPPGCEYELYLTCHWGEPIDEIRKFAYDLKCCFIQYYGHGGQIGAQQQVADSCGSKRVFIGFTSHAYFHRAGWLKRIMDVWDKFGSGLYGVCSSHEGGTLHLRTNCYAVDAGSLSLNYTHKVNTLEEGHAFEHGDWCFSDWYAKQYSRAPLVVHWDSVNDLSEQVENGYRDGNQEQLLVWDRHTDIYAEADDKEKTRLSELAHPTYGAIPV